MYHSTGGGGSKSVLATWSLFRPVDRSKPFQSSSCTPRKKRAWICLRHSLPFSLSSPPCSCIPVPFSSPSHSDDIACAKLSNQSYALITRPLSRYRRKRTAVSGRRDKFSESRIAASCSWFVGLIGAVGGPANVWVCTSARTKE